MGSFYDVAVVAVVAVVVVAAAVVVDGAVTIIIHSTICLIDLFVDCNTNKREHENW